MFRPMRRQKKALPPEAAEALLREERRGVLAVNGDDGYPYAIPVNFLYDPDTRRIYFHGARAGHKADALRRSDKACFTVYGHETVKQEPWAPHVQSVVAFGRCRLLPTNPVDTALLRRIARKYYPEESLIDGEIASSGKAVQLYEIEIEHLTAKEIQER